MSTTEQAERNPGGRPPKLIVDAALLAKVEQLAASGLSQGTIAIALDVDEDTITRTKKRSAAFADAIKRGRAKGEANLAARMYQLAMRGNVTALIWMEKSRHGRSEKIRHENENHNADLSDLTDEQLERLAAGEPLVKVLGGRRNAA
jgi:alpha-D-ribose 1-methylphosphonate 5-triphosphate diphosphatase PhnM